MKVWASYTLRPSTCQAALDLLRLSVISLAEPGEVVVEVLIRRLDYVVERLVCSGTAQLLMHREHAGGGADDGERGHAPVEVEDGEGGHPTPASSALGSSGMCSPPVGSGRRAGLQRAAARSGPESSS
jgi:hypothetical protein